MASSAGGRIWAPRYSDNEDSRFYKTASLSPEDTWRALSDELMRVLMDAQRAFWRSRLEVDPERIRWWHGAIFARHFPLDGGRFRRERAFFGVVTDGGGMRQIEGSPPDALRQDLREVCAAFNSGSARFDRQGMGIAEQTRVVAALYAGILRVHPFADGNHRTAFVALSAALWSLGLPAVEFAADIDMADHESAVAPALISPDGDIEPFGRRLATRIEHARSSTT